MCHHDHRLCERQRPPQSLAAVRRLSHVRGSSWHLRQSPGANPGVSGEQEMKSGTPWFRIDAHGTGETRFGNKQGSLECSNANTG